MPKVNPTPNPMSVLKSSGCAALAGGSMMSSMDQATIEARTTETVRRLLDAVERRDQQLQRRPALRELRVHLAAEWVAAPKCGQSAGRLSENLEDVTCQKCLNPAKEPKVKPEPRGQRGARLHAAPPRVDQGTAWCPSCETVLPLEFFGTYPAPKLSGKQHATCLPCRIPDTGIPDPGAGKLMCDVCGFPLNTHPLGAWCFQ